MNVQFTIGDGGERDSVEIRVRGRVQGVGFRPTVWRHAQDCGVEGEVLNDGEGVLVRAHGLSKRIERLITMIVDAPPPLANIDAIEVAPYFGHLGSGFRIVESERSDVRTEIAPDAGICPACAAEINDPFARRYRYPFTNCTHCGPRLTIVESVPYDRATTTMSTFGLCADCAAEYADPADRRFHAEPIACHVCGPRARLVRLDGRAVSYEQHSMLDDVDAAMSLIQKGEIVAIKALGGYQLACDATKPEVVARLRQAKGRDGKPFALMARDVGVIANYCSLDPREADVLRSAAAPIVLLDADGPERLPEAVAPGINTLGFMLPSTPLHVLMFKRMTRPVVMTSGNIAGGPQIIDDDAALTGLASIATYALVHNRRIANRVDDSVVRLAANRVRVLRRARGYAPASLPLPPGFEQAPAVLAYGPELKATFCLVRDGRAVLSQHQGDLEDVGTYDDYRKNHALFAAQFDHVPAALAADAHPEYLSTKLAKQRSASDGLPLVEVQHHHAHMAACLAENARPLGAPPVLGIVLDGLGFGSDGALWGGEFLYGSYSGFERLGTFKPVALPGGAMASWEPWRNLHAHLLAEMGWTALEMNFSALELFRRLSDKPRALLESGIRSGINAPRASSCGRLFDAVAAALGLCFDRQAYEGEAAMLLEAAVSQEALADEGDELAYPLNIPRLNGTGLPYVEPLAMWNAILGDLVLSTPVPVMAARFHKGLAKALAAMAVKLARRDAEDSPRFDTVALSGGCFHNRILLEETTRRLEGQNFTVLTHAAVPAGDGGVSLGQAAIAAARLLYEMQTG